MSLVIRPSRDNGVEIITPIYAETVRTGTASWEVEPPSVEEFAERRREIMDKGFPYFVAGVDGNVVGYSYASSYRARIGYRFTVEDSVYVSPAAGGRGVGKALLNRLVDACREQDFRNMIAVIGDSNNRASIALHEACGFHVVGVFPELGFKSNCWLDSGQMMRKL